MKYFITIVLTIALIQLTNCQNDYGDDGDLFSYDPIEDREDDTPKPIYKLEEAPRLFEEFVKKFKKTYKNEDDRKTHYENFLKNLKEINMINSDKEFSSTVDINLFADFSEEERRHLVGVPDY